MSRIPTSTNVATTGKTAPKAAPYSAYRRVGVGPALGGAEDIGTVGQRALGGPARRAHSILYIVRLARGCVNRSEPHAWRGESAIPKLDAHAP